MDNDNRDGSPRQKVWLREEERTATVRRVESHPNHGKQYLVTVYSPTWGAETYWVKESNVQEIGTNRWSANGNG